MIDSAGLEQPVGEVAGGAQPGDLKLDRAGPGVEGSLPLAVSPVGSLVESPAPCGAAQGVGLGRHELLGEGLHHLADQVVAALVVEVLVAARPGGSSLRGTTALLSGCLLPGFPEVAAVVVAEWGTLTSRPGRAYLSYTTPKDSNRGSRRSQGR